MNPDVKIATKIASRLPKKSGSYTSIFPDLMNSEQSENKAKLDLLMKLRVGAILGQCLVIWPAVKMDWLQVSLVGPFCLVVALLSFLTVGSIYALQHRMIPATQGFIFFQLGLDTIALALLLKFSGGPWNPFVSLMLFHAALGALNLRGAWLTYFVIFVSWCLALVHWNPSLPPALVLQPTPSSVLFPVQSLVLLLFVALLIWSNHQIEHHRKALMRVREEKNKIDRLRAFGVIATGFSHEFATPLATLKLKLTRIKNRENSETDPDLEIALEAASQAERSLKSMMSEKFLPENYEFVKMELSSTIKKIITCLEKDKSNIEFTHPNSEIWLRAPQVSFNQMILDLFDNAHRANQELNTQKIQVAIYLQSGHAAVDICDRGPGFPSWVMDHVGTPFFSTRSESAGLGLYHAHVLCQAMGGEIMLENIKDQGAKVTLRFPIAESQIKE
jgi:two-component system, sensor histidine kinase RegB